MLPSVSDSVWQTRAGRNRNWPAGRNRIAILHANKRYRKIVPSVSSSGRSGMGIVAGCPLAGRLEQLPSRRRILDGLPLHEARHGRRNALPANADIREHAVVQGCQLADCGASSARLPIRPRELPQGQDNSPEEAGEGGSHRPRL